MRASEKIIIARAMGQVLKENDRLRSLLRGACSVLERIHVPVINAGETQTEPAINTASGQLRHWRALDNRDRARRATKRR